jgi:hypothetical protein
MEVDQRMARAVDPLTKENQPKSHCIDTLSLLQVSEPVMKQGSPGRCWSSWQSFQKEFRVARLPKLLTGRLVQIGSGARLPRSYREPIWAKGSWIETTPGAGCYFGSLRNRGQEFSSRSTDSKRRVQIACN